jgi:hypothetical protein
MYLHFYKFHNHINPPACTTPTLPAPQMASSDKGMYTLHLPRIEETMINNKYFTKNQSPSHNYTKNMNLFDCLF